MKNTFFMDCRAIMRWITIGLLCFVSLASGATKEPLPPEKAFVLSAKLANPSNLVLRWDIAPGIYLYREHFAFQLKASDQTQLGKIVFPPAKMKADEIQGTYAAYTNQLVLNIPLLNAAPGQKALIVSYQGCAEDGFCYPPMTQRLILNLAQPFEASILTMNPPEQITQRVAETTPADKVMHLLATHNLLLVILGFFGFGLLLSFTPCVLPMIPVLSGIIAGQHELTTGKAFRLSLVYVLSMAGTYAVLGLLVTTIGGQLQSTLQKPWILVLFISVFVGLALSLFGLYELRLPAKISERLHHVSQKRQGGTYLGVAIMGSLSTLVLSPCVTPPLAGALVYIGQTGNLLIGSMALFAMGLGAGMPLLLIGTSGGKLLPRAGVWMNVIKNIFGVLLLVVALILLERIISGPIILILWAALFIISAVYMGALSPIENGWRNLWKGFGFTLLVYGVILIVSASLGGHDPLQPFESLLITTQAKAVKNLPLFIPVKSSEDVDDALSNAKGKIVMLDFYADWCVSCKQMEKYTFTHHEVQVLLSQIVLLRADITANDVVDRNLQQRFHVIAPPTILFFGPDGKELTTDRIIGEINADELSAHLRKVLSL